MSKFLDAAFQVLKQHGRPLTAKEITERALDAGLFETTGRTPAQTMKSKLSTAILRKRERSPFMRTAEGQFGLREWKAREFVAQRQAKRLLAEDAMVFPATMLNRYAPSPGLWPVSIEHGAELTRHCFPMKRSDAESDLSVIQLVSGFVVQHAGRVLTYKRTRRLPEARLHGEFSVMFGGHLNPDDVGLLNIFDPANFAVLQREFYEELRLDSGNTYDMRFRGILYDDSREVSRQHVAVLYDVFLATAAYTVGERGFLQQDKFETWSEVGSRLEDFENWSQLLFRLYRQAGD